MPEKRKKRNPGGQAGAPIQDSVQPRDSLEAITTPYRKQPPSQFFRLVEQLHRLGPRPVGECLLELAGIDELVFLLDRYGRLNPDVVEALGADKFPPPPLVLVPHERDGETCPAGLTHIGEVADVVVVDTARRSIVRHLDAATASADTASFRAADAIRLRAGWPWSEIIRPPAKLGSDAA